MEEVERETLPSSTPALKSVDAVEKLIADSPLVPPFASQIDALSLMLAHKTTILNRPRVRD